MAYNPQFTRSTYGNYADDKSYLTLVMGTQAQIMDDEFNEMQWLQGAQRGLLIEELHASGFFGKGTDSVTTSTLTIGSRDALVNGQVVHMIGQSANSGNVLVPLTAPASGTKTDLVYLVMYLTEISYQSGAIPKYGYLQGDTIANDMLDGRAPGETTRRIQKQWTVKYAPGVSTMTDASLGYTATSKDAKLFTKNNASTADGVEYAIPLYNVNWSSPTANTLTDLAFYIRSALNAGQANGYATLGSDGHVPSAQLPALNYIPTSAEGVANGVATLGSDGKVPSAQLPALNYVPTSEVGTANGVAELDANGHVPASELPNATGTAVGAVAVPASSGTGVNMAVVKNVANREVQLTGTGASTISTFTPTADGLFIVPLSLRVTGGSNVTITATISWTDETGAQTDTRLNAQSVAPGTMDVPIKFISAKSGSAITVKVTAGTANVVYASSAIVGVS